MTAPRFHTGGHHRQHPLRGKESKPDTKREMQSERERVRKRAREQGRESREDD